MKLVWLSDVDATGSGYRNLSIPLCEGLAKLGHDVKVVGLGYRGEQHDFPFSIIPATTFQEGHACITNLDNLWKFDVLIVALDIPLQEQFLYKLQNRQYKYVGIMPLEADPLCMSWAMVLMMMDKALIISEFGTEEANAAGVPAAHLPIGIDTTVWRPSFPEEYTQLRTSFGFDEETFVILTVADNQERKYLSAAFEIVGNFCKEFPNTKYILVTREHLTIGWKLRDLAQSFGLNNNLMVFERGMKFQDLWGLYAIADTMLLTSKAEGLGMPLLEAMAMKIPCIATNCTGMKELLYDDRGYLIDYDYIYIDPFGNGRRYYIDRGEALTTLKHVHSVYKTEKRTDKAYEFAKARTWDKSVAILDEQLKGLIKK